MIKEIFKKQVCINEITENGIDYVIRLAAPSENLKDGALSTVLQSNKAYLFQPTDKLYFLAGCTVPRFKVKQLCEATGMTTVKAIENSTVTIYGDETERSVIRSDYSYYNITKEKIIWFIENNYEIGNSGLLALKQILNDPESYPYVEVIHYNTKNVLEGYRADWVLNPISKDAFTGNNCWVTEEAKINAFDSMLEDGRTLVHQNDLLTIININNVMDREMYDQTCKMFESEDTNNHVLAIEIMANCDYEKSALYLYLLMKDHSRKIAERNESKHVNYQALCKFFDIRRDHRPYDIERVIQELSERNLINSTHKQDLYELSKEECSDRLGNDFYTVTVIEASEKLEKVFKRGDLYLAGEDIPEELLDKDDDDDDDDEEEEVDNELEEQEVEDDDEQL